MFSLPSVMAPAARSRATAVHSRGPVKYSAVLVPHEVGRPGMWQRSLYASGTPWSAPRQRPAVASASSARAAASAPSASTVMKLLIVPSNRAIRSRKSRVASTGEIFFARMASASETSVQSLTVSLLLLGARLERGDEVRWLLGQREVSARALDQRGEAGDIRFQVTIAIGHGGSR